MLSSNSILILNIISWAIITIIFYRKRKRIDSAVFLLITFLVYSICSYLTYDFDLNNTFGGKSLTLFPLVYLFAMILLTMSPILRFDIAKVKSFSNNRYQVLDILLWIYIVCMIIKLPLDLPHIRQGISLIMMNQGADLYTDVMAESKLDSGAYLISSLPSIYINVTTEIITLIAFYNLYKKRKKKLTIASFIAIALAPLGSIANGQRGGTFDIIITVIGTYFLFAPILEKKIKKVAKKVGIIAIIVLMIPIFALTQSRFGSRGEGVAEQSVYSYMGQQNINFDLYAFDNNGLRNGDRVFPLFKKMLGFENVPNDFWERRLKYPNLKINDEVFIGYIGDFLLDFGPLISTIIFILFAVIFLRGTKVCNNSCYFYQLLLFQFVLTLGLHGGLKLYPFADTHALKIFAFGLLYWYLKFDKNNKITSQQVNSLIK